MELRFNKWGNSLGARFPKAITEMLGVTDGSVAQAEIIDGKIVISADPLDRLKAMAAGLDMEAMCAHITDDNRPDPEDADWGPPVGREIW